MWFLVLAFNMGLLASLHCIGMCGPLSILAHTNMKKSTGSFGQVSSTILYQFGRTIAYMALGLIFGLVGQAFGFVGLQKVVTIIMGSGLIVVGLFSLNIDRLMGKSPLIEKSSKLIIKVLTRYYERSGNTSVLVVGFLNGLIPCGIVYFALASATAAMSLQESVLYMLFFGLGTTPLMVLFTLFGNGIKSKFNLSYQKILPWFAFFTRFVMIWRSFAIEIPMDLSLILSMKNPVMCHW